MPSPLAPYPIVSFSPLVQLSRGYFTKQKRKTHQKKPPATQASVCDTPSVRLQMELRMLTLYDVISRAPQTFSFFFCSTRRK